MHLANVGQSNPPIPLGPPPKYQGVATRHFTSAHTPTNGPAQSHFPPVGNTHRGEPSKYMQSPQAKMRTTEDPKEIIIAVMGITGTGKSYFIREVSGISDVEVSSGLHSCTAKVKPYSFPYAGTKITLVDTPGFNDTTRSDTEVLRDICVWMSSSYGRGKLLSGVIYLHRISDVRMDGSSMKYVKMFQRLCGPNALKNVLLTTTRWSEVAQEQGEMREEELRNGDFWGGLITEGAAVDRFMGTRESGLELINKLMGNEPKPLDIQDEMGKGIPMAETNAGKFMDGELASLHKKYQKEVKDLRNQLRKAVKAKDDLLKELLADQRAESQRRAKEIADQKKLLADLQADAMRKLREDMEKREEEERRKDRAVIAVAAKDISVLAHLTSLFTSYSTRGRLIYDIDDEEEFDKELFDIEIREQSNALFSPITATVKTVAECFDAGMSRSNYIIYNQGYYLCKPSSSVKIGSRDFIIFSKY